MKMRETQVVAGEPEAVWALLADPGGWPHWTHPSESVSRTRTGMTALGERFQLITRWTGERQVYAVETLDLQRGRRIVYRCRTPWNGREQTMDLAFDLEPVAGGTRVTCTSVISRESLPWYARWLIRFILLIGRPVPTSQGMLDHLRRHFARSPA